MKLILLHFNPVQGPKVFKSYPEDIPPGNIRILLGLMDVQHDRGIFEYRKYQNSKSQFTIMPLDIPSEWARGQNEHLMLAIQSERAEQLSFVHYNINRLAEKIKNNSEVYKAFYIDRKGEDRDIRKQYDWLMLALDKTYKILESKYEQLVVVDRLFQQENINDSDDVAKIIQTLARTFITVIDARVPEGAVVLFDVGSVLADKYEGFFRSTELDILLDEVSRFWKRYAFGEIDDLVVEQDNMEFCVYDCFECSHFPNVNQTVCKFDEGFLTGLLSRKLDQKEVIIEEIECYASGFDHCKFQVKMKDKKDSSTITL